MSKYDIERIEKEIMERLDKGETVYIESGAANDCITSYHINKYGSLYYGDWEIIFTTTACIFPEKIMLTNWDNVDTEEFQGKLFVYVW